MNEYVVKLKYVHFMAHAAVNRHGREYQKLVLGVLSWIFLFQDDRVRPLAEEAER